MYDLEGLLSAQTSAQSSKDLGPRGGVEWAEWEKMLLLLPCAAVGLADPLFRPFFLAPHVASQRPRSISASRQQTYQGESGQLGNC